MLFNQQYQQQRKKGSILVPKPVAAHSPYWCSCQHNKYCITNIYYSYYRQVWFIMQVNERLVELAILVLLVQLQHTLRTCAAVTITDWWQVYFITNTNYLYYRKVWFVMQLFELYMYLRLYCLYNCVWNPQTFWQTYWWQVYFITNTNYLYYRKVWFVMQLFELYLRLYCLYIVYSGKWNPQTFGIWQTMECTNMCGM